MSNGAPSAYSPREWVGDETFPWPPTLGLADGDAVNACFAVNSVTLGRTRSNAAFLKLQLADAHGVIEARMWDDVDAVAEHVRPGSYIGVRGIIESYQDQRQLKVDELALLRIELDDLVLFLPRSARPPERMNAELDALIAAIADEPLRDLLVALLDAGSETGHAFRMAPAAKQNHHAYLGGLIEHTLSVAHVCVMLAAHYGDVVDRDLLVAGALLHDIGKIREIGARGGFPYTDEGKLLGHILIGLQIVADAAARVPALPPQRLLLLQHLIASHQGRYEWQSPREPRILEGLILHYADDLDAKMNQAGGLFDAVTAGWTAYDRSLGRDFLKHRGEGLPGAARPPGGPDVTPRAEDPAPASRVGAGSDDDAVAGVRRVQRKGTPASGGETGQAGAGRSPADAGGAAAADVAPDDADPLNGDEPEAEARRAAGQEPPGLGTLDLFEES